MGIRKKFSQELYDQYDHKAKKICKEYYKKLNVILMENSDKYGPDLKYYSNFDAFEKHEHTGFIECEVKRVWKDYSFPFESVQFPERKARYVYQSDVPVTFFMLNAKCDRALIVDGKDVLKSPMREVKNMYVSKVEWFFQVPLDKVTFVDINNKKI